MKKIILGIFILVISTLVSCKVDVDPTSDTNSVEFTIKTDDDSLAKGATVLIYGSEEAYKTAYANFDTSRSNTVFSGRAIDGKFKQNLFSNKTYWVRIIYLKPNSDSLFSENALYSNDGVGVQFGPFESNNFDGTKITTKATVTLYKAYSFLVVAAKDTSKVNVEVYNAAGGKCKALGISNQLYHSEILDKDNLPDNTSDIDITTTRYLVFVVPQGKIKINYKNSLGCVSTVEKYISGGGRIEKDLLEPCTSGNIVFYNTSNFTDIKIILLNPNDTIGTLSSKSSNLPTCNTTSVSNSYIKVSRSLGEYRYIATSKSCNCEIPGVVKLSYVGQCMPVEISMKK